VDDEQQGKGTTGQERDTLRNLDALMGKTEVLRIRMALRTGKTLRRGSQTSEAPLLLLL
jgi:hypothetical protein